MMEAHELLGLIWAQVWQLTLLIAAVAIAVRLLARRRAHLAHALWLVVLVKCVTPPLWSSPTGIFSRLETAFVRSDDPAIAKHALPPPVAPDVTAIAKHELTGPDFLLELQDTDAAAEHVCLDPSLFSLTHQPREFGVAGWLVIAWLAGTGLTIAITMWRWYRCRWQLHRHRIAHDSELDDTLARLAGKLKLRRRVRLMVTASRFGPAVMGLLRPVIVLPEIIVRGKAIADVEPVLAHELIHVRRGDLWIGMLQTVAQGLWWFHPLVWLANRLITRETERCCDEEVLASLRCEPAEYARCLLGVLERRQVLRPVPAFPGVRPVDVTSRRLERIMLLRHGCRQRTPWWCWMVMLLVTAATLPGAAWVRAQEEGQLLQDLQSDTLPNLSAVGSPQPIPLPAHGYAGFRPPQFTGPRITRVYDVSEALDAVLEEFDCGMVAARKYLAGDMMAVGGGDWKIRGLKLKAKDENTSAIDKAVRKSKRPELRFNGTQAVVQHDAEGHQRIAKLLDRISTHGLAQIEVDIRFIEADQKLVDREITEWQMRAMDLPDEESTDDIAAYEAWQPNERSPGRGHATSSTEHRQPVIFRILDETDQFRILETLQDAASSKLLTAPRVMMHNGQSAMVRVGVQRPFVVGMLDEKPQIRVCSEGSQLHVRPKLLHDESAEHSAGGVNERTASGDQIRLDFEFVHSEILDVTKTTVKVAGRTEPVTLQVPELRKSRVESSITLPPDHTVIVGGLQARDGKKRPRSLLVAMTVRRVKSEMPASMLDDRASGDAGRVEQASHEEPDDWTELPQPRALKAGSEQDGVSFRVYDVADLVTPPPHFTGAQWDGVRQQWRGRGPAVESSSDFGADLDTIVEMIQTTIAPDSWQDVGGPGAIEPFETNLSLVVSQSRDVHEQIADLLEQLRRLQKVQVTLETHVVGLPDSFFERIGMDFDFEIEETPAGEVDGTRRRGRAVLKEIEAVSFVQGAQGDGRATPANAPRIGVAFDFVTDDDGGGGGFDDFLKQKNAVLSDIEAFFLLQTVQENHRSRLAHAPKMTLFNGQTATLQFGDDESRHTVLARPVISEDRQSVHMSYLSSDGTGNEKMLDKQPSLTIRNGHSLLINLTDHVTPGQLGWAKGVGVPMLNKLPNVDRLFKNMPEQSIDHVFVLVTPRIVIRE